MAVTPAAGLAADDTVLEPGAALAEEHLAPGESRPYRIELPAGQAAELSLRQLSSALSSLQLRWPGDPARAVSRVEGGRQDQIRVTLLADDAAPLRVEIAGRRKDLASSYAIALGPSHPIEAGDRRRAAAQALQAKADDLRAASGSSELGQNAGSKAVQEALAAYREAMLAWRAVPDGCGVRRTYSGEARLRFSHGDYVGAAGAADAALATACDRGDDLSGAAEEAEAARTLGAALAYQGDYQAAIKAQEQAAALYRRTGDSAYQNAVFGNLSSNYNEIGEWSKAESAAQDALRAATAAGDAKRVLYAQVNVADTLFVRGALSSALDLYTQILAQARQTPYPLVENMAWNSLGLLYRELGERQQALQAYQSAEQVASANHDRSAIAEALHNQGDAALESGDAAAATDAFNRALAIARADQLGREEVFDLRGLGRSAMIGGNWAEADTQLRAAAAIAESEAAHAAQIDVELSLGELELRQDHAGPARDHYRKALANARQAHALNPQPVALAGAARSELAQDDLPAAKRDIEEALALIESERAKIDAPSLRGSYFDSKRSYYELHIEILMRLERLHPGQGHAEAALRSAEQARARSLQDLLVERGVAIGRDIDPALLAQEQQGEDQLRAAAYQLASVDAAAPPARRKSLQQSVEDAEARLDRIRGRIRAASPRYAALLHPRGLDVMAVRSGRLDGDTVLLEYWLGDAHSYLWALSREGLRSYTLPGRADIDSLAQRLRGLLTAPAPADLPIEQLAEAEAERLKTGRAIGSELGAILLQPAAQTLKRHRQAVVVADGPLQLLPFCLLEQGDAADAAGADHDWAYLPSITTLLWLRQGGTVGRRRLAVLADPVFRADDPRLRGAAAAPAAQDAAPVSRAASDVGLDGLPRLPHSREEAQAVAQLFPTATPWLALDFEASRAAVLQADWHDYGVVHFATHALLDLRHPDLSGVVLSLYDAQGHPTDGYLRMNDVYNLDLPADLVVLSACESALGPDDAAEGIYSLARAFFYAGAPRVLGSLWAVDDRAGAEFMKQFYRALLIPGARPAGALRAAQQAIAADPRWNAPYYWAGYVLQGDWR